VLWSAYNEEAGAAWIWIPRSDDLKGWRVLKLADRRGSGGMEEHSGAVTANVNEVST
jgi:hypothetical protein